MSRVRACWATQSAVGRPVTPRMCTSRLACSTPAKQYSLVRSTVSQWKKSHAKTPLAWARRNSAQVGPERRGGRIDSGAFEDRPDRAGTDLRAHAGKFSADASGIPSPGSGQRGAESGLRSGGDGGGRPDCWRVAVPRRVITSACQRRSVPGVRNRCRRRVLGSSRASALIRARSTPGRARTGDLPTQEATWWRSTRISAVVDASDRARSAIQALN